MVHFALDLIVAATGLLGLWIAWRNDHWGAFGGDPHRKLFVEIACGFWGVTNLAHAILARVPELAADHQFFSPASYMLPRLVLPLLLLAVASPPRIVPRFVGPAVMSGAVLVALLLPVAAKYYYPDRLIGRPWDLLPAFWALVAIGWLQRNGERWSRLGALLGCSAWSLLIAQLIMSASHQIDDVPFRAAHLASVAAMVPLIAYAAGTDRPEYTAEGRP